MFSWYPDHIQVQNNNTVWGIRILGAFKFETTTPHADLNLAGNVEKPRIYTKYILFVKVKKKTNCLLEYSFIGSD